MVGLVPHIMHQYVNGDAQDPHHGLGAEAKGSGQIRGHFRAVAGETRSEIAGVGVVIEPF